MPLDLDKVEELIRTEQEPLVSAEKLRLMIEAAHPAPPFLDGEELLMHEFVARFKRAVCANNETRFWPWPVKVRAIEEAGDGRSLLVMEIEL